ncbi:hypothetical protein D5S17_26475 [Pseudonocardiaceae bacterium YIM PH 21723]|nr:hypothetical protein D5S17_26475 [Pseudonocardiaceae bacterium YIM PH 21723]
MPACRSSPARAACRSSRVPAACRSSRSCRSRACPAPSCRSCPVPTRSWATSRCRPATTSDNKAFGPARHISACRTFLSLCSCGRKFGHP